MRIENGAYLRMHAEHEKLRVESGTCSHSEPPTSRLAPDALLHVPNLRWNWCCLGSGGSALIPGWRGQHSDTACEPCAGLLARRRDYAHPAPKRDSPRLCRSSIKNEQLMLVI